jgi:hypothetical protein
MHPRPFAFAVAALALSLTSCLKATDNSGGTPIGIMSMNARTKGTGYTTYPVLNFYSARTAVFTAAQSRTDSCTKTTYTPNSTDPNVGVTQIGGGVALAINLSGRADTLRKVSATNSTYTLTSNSGMSFTPGDSITLIIPGDLSGYPRTTFVARTAEPYTFGAVTVPAVGTAMPLTWSAAADLNSAMLVMLRYSSTNNGSLDTQIFCDYADDGTATVPAALASLWAASTTRTFFSQRLRTIVAQPSGTNVYFNLISTFDLPTPVSP